MSNGARKRSIGRKRLHLFPKSGGKWGKPTKQQRQIVERRETYGSMENNEEDRRREARSA